MKALNNYKTYLNNLREIKNDYYFDDLSDREIERVNNRIKFYEKRINELERYYNYKA